MPWNFDIRKGISIGIVMAFLANTMAVPPSYAQSRINLPAPQQMLSPSVKFSPAILTGMTIHPENPLQFDFIIDSGDDHLKDETFKRESQKLINYFMAALTVPEDEMWVNLSPYEKNRIIADGLGNTEMGRDMLAQDYLLKQLTASLLYPEKGVGKEFWQRIYSAAKEKFGTTDIPTHLFNKVWIIPQEADIYVNANNVFVTKSHLKVMLEEDYLAMDKNIALTRGHVHNKTNKNVSPSRLPNDAVLNTKAPQGNTLNALSSHIIRQIILPEIEKEVNEGKNFANLRQIYHSMILATWYKSKLKNSLLSTIYLDKNKTKGIELEDKAVKEKIYAQYLKSFKKGVYNYIKEDYDFQSQKIVPRKYFLGGLKFEGISQAMLTKGTQPSQEWIKEQRNPKNIVRVNAAMLVNNPSKALRQMEEDNKKLIVYLAWQKLYAQVKEGDRTAILKLKVLVKNRPGFFNSSLLEDLFNVSDKPDSYAYEAIAEFVSQRPDLINEQFVTKLLDRLIHHPDKYKDIAKIFGYVAKSKPQLITTHVVQTILQFQNTSDREKSFDFDVRGKLLVEIIKANHSFADQIVAKLMNELKAKSIPLRPRALYAAEILEEIHGIVPGSTNINAISSQLERLSVDQDTTPLYLRIAAKVNPVLIEKDDVHDLLSKITSEGSTEHKIEVWQAIGALVETRPDLISQEFAQEIIVKSSWFIEEAQQEIMINVLYAIAKISPEFHAFIVSKLWEELIGAKDFVSIGVAPILKKLILQDKVIGKEVLGKILFELKGGYSENYTIGSSSMSLLKSISQIMPEEFNDDVMEQVFAYKKSAFFNHIEKELTEIIYNISKINRLRAKRLMARAIKKEDGLGRFFADNNDDFYMESGAVPFVLKVSPELLTEQMANRLMQELLTSEEHRYQYIDTEEDLLEIYKLRPDLISSKFLFEYCLKKERDLNVLVGILQVDGIASEVVDSYRMDLMYRWNISSLRREEMDNALFIYSFLITQGENADFIGKFAYQDDKQFETLLNSVLSYIKAGEYEKLITLLQSYSDLKRTNKALSDTQLLSIHGLELYQPTRSWDNLEEWVNALTLLPHLSDKIVSHIIVTMDLLKQGVGEQVGFRSRDSVENRLPRIRRSLVQALKVVPSVTDKKRLTKVLSLGTSGDVDALRKQAIVMVQATTGGRDSREGIVGRIRDRIHNQQSPQDLHVVKAYRDFVANGNEQGLRFYEYEPTETDIVNKTRKNDVLKAIDQLIVTLEFIYGDQNLTSMNDFLDKLNLRNQEQLPNKVRDFIVSKNLDQMSRLEELVVIRKNLHEFILQAEGEDLLSAIQLDNRLELLYYKFFNEAKENIDVGDLFQAMQFLRNILKNVALSGYSTQEMDQIVREVQDLEKKGLAGGNLLRFYALLKRIENIIRFHARETINQYQEMAQQLAKAIEMQNSIWVENFSSNLFRADAIYLLSALLSDIKKKVMEKVEISGWQVVVPGQASGRMHILSSLEDLSSVKSDEIIVIERLPSDAPAITNVKAIIVLTEDGLLSHPAINARQNNIPMVVAPSLDVLVDLNGKNVVLKTQGDEDVVITETHEKLQIKTSMLREKEKITIQPIKPDLNPQAGFIIDQKDYQQKTVGNKAFRLGRISSKSTPNERPTKHFALSFGLHNHVLHLPENEKIKNLLDQLYLDLQREMNLVKKANLLVQMRSAVRRLEVPESILDAIVSKIKTDFNHPKNVFIRSTTNVEDLPDYSGAGLYDSFGTIKPEHQAIDMAIKNVWASIWNERAFLDRELHGIDHKQAMPAVLIQETIIPKYAFVVHTQNPSNPEEWVIELVQGFGESLVSGEEDFIGSPYRYVYNRKTGMIKMVRFSSKGKILSIGVDGETRTFIANYIDDPLDAEEAPEVIKSIVESTLQIESQYGTAQDIEGAIVMEDQRHMQFSLLQSRNQVNQFWEPQLVTALVPAANQAMTSNVGGIDFNPSNLKLRQQGKNEDFQFNFKSLRNIKSNTIQGVSPTIVNITPVTNFLLLLGLGKDK